MRCEGCEKFRADYQKSIASLQAEAQKMVTATDDLVKEKLTAGERNDALVSRLMAVQKAMAEAGYPAAANMMNAIWEKT